MGSIHFPTLYTEEIYFQLVGVDKAESPLGGKTAKSRTTLQLDFSSVIVSRNQWDNRKFFRRCIFRIVEIAGIREIWLSSTKQYVMTTLRKLEERATIAWMIGKRKESA